MKLKTLPSNRKYERISPLGEGELHTNTGPGNFTLTDISACGIGIDSRQDLAIGQDMSIKLIMHIPYRNKEIKVRGKVIHKNETDKGYHYGINFIDIKNEEMIDIDEIVGKRSSTSYFDSGLFFSLILITTIDIDKNLLFL